MLTFWWLELEFGAIGGGELVGDWVESKVTGEDKGGDHLGGGHEAVGSGVTIVTTGEVTVVGGDDGVLLTLLLVLGDRKK